MGITGEFIVLEDKSFIFSMVTEDVIRWSDMNRSHPAERMERQLGAWLKVEAAEILKGLVPFQMWCFGSMP